MNFDWTTFALQLVNVLILLAILRHFLFRPVAAIIAQRQKDSRAALERAEAARAEAEAATQAARAQEQASLVARQEILARAAGEARTRREEMLAAAREEAAGIVAAGRAARQREDERAGGRAMARLGRLAASIARRAVEAQPRGPEGYLARLEETLERMDARERAALLQGGALAVLSAAPLDEALEAQVAALLARYDARAETRVVPELIAGIELRSESGAVRNSLAHDLDQLAKAAGEDNAGT